MKANIANKHRRTGRGAVAPPIRAVCRHEFGQRVNIIRAKHNTCLNNTNLGSVTGVNGKNPNLGSVTVGKGKNSAKFCHYPPPPTENMDPGNFLLLPPPPHWIHSGKTRSAPPKWMLARTPMLINTLFMVYKSPFQSSVHQYIFRNILIHMTGYNKFTRHD